MFWILKWPLLRHVLVLSEQSFIPQGNIFLSDYYMTRMQLTLGWCMIQTTQCYVGVVYDVSLPWNHFNWGNYRQWSWSSLVIYRGAQNNDIIVGFSESSANTQMMVFEATVTSYLWFTSYSFSLLWRGVVIDFAKTNQEKEKFGSHIYAQNRFWDVRCVFKSWAFDALSVPLFSGCHLIIFLCVSSLLRQVASWCWKIIGFL